jgi:hypothetical protein
LGWGTAEEVATTARLQQFAGGFAIVLEGEAGIVVRFTIFNDGTFQ